jgi:hypothetical protein
MTRFTKIILLLFIITGTFQSCKTSHAGRNPYLESKQRVSEREMKKNKKIIRKQEKLYRKQQRSSRKHLFGRSVAPK